jgi:CIC family chloride channel protein
MGLLVGIMTAAVEYFTPMMYDYFNFISVKKFEFLLWIIPIIIIIKMLLTSITLGAGGFGGSFAPGLIIGVYSGILFWKVASLLLVGWGLKENTYVLVAIAGIIGGFFDAPFAGSLFVLELTGDYNLILPALMTSVISNFNVKLLEK